MTSYPHTFERGYCTGCHADGKQFEDCPAAMLAHIAELKRGQASVIKAQAAGYEAGRQAGYDTGYEDGWKESAAAIERGDHR